MGVVPAPAANEPRRMSVEEFMALPDDTRAELVDGVLVVSPPTGAPHGAVNMRLAGLLSGPVFGGHLGYLFDAATAFLLRSDPPLVRSPDVSFVARQRLPDGLGPGPVHGAPDLAVEVLSPSNRQGEIARKVAEYFQHGSRLVWVVDPEDRSVTVYGAGPFPRWLGGADVLDAGDVIPGVSTPVAALFVDLAPRG